MSVDVRAERDLAFANTSATERAEALRLFRDRIAPQKVGGYILSGLLDEQAEYVSALLAYRRKQTGRPIADLIEEHLAALPEQVSPGWGKWKLR